MSGFIALHRTLLEWEWYSEPNTCRLFLHCLLKANWKDKNYRGKIVKRGHFLTSLEVLADETGLSIQKVRTAISNLKLTHELTVKSSRQGTEIKVNNYDYYQSITHEATHETTDEQQTANKQSTTTNNLNNLNKDINNICDQEIPAEIPVKTPPKKKAKKAELKPLPENLTLSDHWRELAVKHWAKNNRPDLNPENQFFKFIKNHEAKATRSANWQSNWQTWYCNAPEYTKPQGGIYANGQQFNQQSQPRKLSTIEQSTQVNRANYEQTQREIAELEAQIEYGRVVGGNQY